MSFLGRGSPGLRSPAAGILLAVSLAFSISTAEAKTRRQRAGEYYQSGIAQLQKLLTQPERSRSSDEYLKVIRTLGRVHAASPASGYNDDALLKIGDLYREMSQRYEAEPFRTRAIETYKFLIHDYPHSKLLDKARESISELDAARKNDLARKADPAPVPVKSAEPAKKPEPRAIAKAVERQRGNGEPDSEDAYQAAIRLLDDFRSVPEAEMGVLQYQLVADAFEEAYDANPNGEHAAESLAEMAGMYRDMAARFGEQSHHVRAVEAFGRLAAGFPGSDEAASARKSLASLGAATPPTVAKQEPVSEPITRESTPEPPVVAQQAAPQPAPSEAPGGSRNAPPANATLTSATIEAAAVPNPGETVVVRNLRHWSHPQYTRVAIELDQRVPFEYDRVPNPDRIFFDLDSSLLSAELTAHSTVALDDKFVKSIRVAQNQTSVVRVVFDLKSHAFFGASWLTNPPRLLIELRATEEPVSFAKSEEEQLADKPVRWARNNLGSAILRDDPEFAAAQLPAANASIAGKPAIDANDAYRFIETGLRRASELASQTLRQIEPPATKAAPANPTAGSETPSSAGPSVTPPPKDASKATAVESKKAVERKLAETKPAVTEASSSAAEAKSVSPDKKSPAADAATDNSNKKAAPAKQEPNAQPATLAKLEVNIAPPPLEDLPPPKAADATSRGNRNLVRALGLKVGRVMIDAGHGGHDVGTIGPSGLYEKDVVLDVATRLGKLIEERLGAEVSYTRTDDRYVTFANRTKLANDNGADLFISIHANSARSRGVRGVETYYLNLKGDPWAMAVASRENAASDHSIHELQGLVSKIALNEKIEESREFATRIQKELFDGLSDDTKSLRNRGVRKAPFLVLLGAKMPAVLAEIAFISNPTDEKKLKTTKFRQEIAEHLFKGISGYADSLGSTSLAQKKEPEGM